MHDATNSPTSPPAEIPTQPGRAMLLALAALVSSLCLTGWLGLCRTESFTGYLRAEVATISANCDARIREILAREGTVVGVDQPIVVLADEGLSSRLATRGREVTRLRAELEQARAKADVELVWRLKNLEAEILQTRLRSAGYLKEHFVQQLQDVAWQDYAKQYDALASNASDEEIFKSLLSRSRLPDGARIRAMLEQEMARNAAEVYAAQVELCDRRLVELERLKSGLAAKVRRAVGVDLAETQLAQAVEEVGRLEARQRELTLTTPAYGTVGVFRKRAGQRVAKGEPIVELLDTDQRFLVLDVPSQKVADFEAGMKVELRFPGGEIRAGQVRRIPPQTIPAAWQHTPRASQDSMVCVRIDRIGKLWPDVPIGSAVEVTLEK